MDSPMDSRFVRKSELQLAVITCYGEQFDYLVITSGFTDEFKLLKGVAIAQCMLWWVIWSSYCINHRPLIHVIILSCQLPLSLCPIHNCHQILGPAQHVNVLKPCVLINYNCQSTMTANWGTLRAVSKPKWGQTSHNAHQVCSFIYLHSLFVALICSFTQYIPKWRMPADFMDLNVKFATGSYDSYHHSLLGSSFPKAMSLSVLFVIHTNYWKKKVWLIFYYPMFETRFSVDWNILHW